VEDLGSSDPARDAATLAQTAMARMQDFLHRSRVPTEADTAHLVRFCTSAVTAVAAHRAGG
jgi:hypothetical protein